MAGGFTAASFFVVKNLPFVDIPADGRLSMYACIVNKKANNTD